jgi:hypothetical protein
MLADGSPSCGSSFLHDGRFAGERHAGTGVNAPRLHRNNCAGNESSNDPEKTVKYGRLGPWIFPLKERLTSCEVVCDNVCARFLKVKKWNDRAVSNVRIKVLNMVKRNSKFGIASHPENVCASPFVTVHLIIRRHFSD